MGEESEWILSDSIVLFQYIVSLQGKSGNKHQCEENDPKMWARNLT